MPTYEYECQKCGVFEVVQKISEDALKECPTCQQKVVRLLSAAPFHLKGAGWYKTDYSSSSKSTAATEPSKTTETKSTDSKSTDAGSSETKKAEKPKSGGGCGGGCSCH